MEPCLLKQHDMFTFGTIHVCCSLTVTKPASVADVQCKETQIRHDEDDEFTHGSLMTGGEAHYISLWEECCGQDQD